METLPFFSSDYSLSASVLTLDKPEDQLESGPESIINICKEEGIKDLFLVENGMSGFVSAYKNSLAEDINLNYGLKTILVNDMADKSVDSINTESKVIIWMKNSQGYGDLIKLYSLAATEGYYNRPRLDCEFLKKHWTDNLMLTIPYYYSFLHRNLLYGSNCRPDFSFTRVSLHKESNRIPFNYLIDEAVDNFATDQKLDIVPNKSIYYRYKKDFLYFLAYKCIFTRTTMDKPNHEDLASCEFSFESFKEQNLISN